jgi:hypothetical protein
LATDALAPEDDDVLAEPVLDDELLLLPHAATAPTDTTASGTASKLLHFRIRTP